MLFLGTMAGNAVHVDSIYMPADVSRHATGRSVTPQQAWIEDAMELAAEDPDTFVVGWGHSHPFLVDEVGFRVEDHAQSEQDIASHPGLALSAVCIVQEFRRKGQLALRASVKWWGPTVPVVRCKC